MKRIGNTYGKHVILFLWMIIPGVRIAAEPANIWASVQFNKSSVVIGEPLLVTVTVYTSTWFTSPPEFSEIQVPDALMINYEQRTGSMRKTIGNKTYPAIEKKFVVYPFREGENVLPALTIVTESPSEGEYKGKRRIIKSPEKKFTVKQPLEDINREKWLTAYGVRLTETWDQSLKGLKQGDVLERRITIRAIGALAALIPPLDLPESAFGNIYPKPHSLSNTQNESSFSGTRTETWIYLLESEGAFKLPEVSVSWFDPRTGSLETTGIPKKEIEIVENPNLDFLLSMQDSLRILLEEGQTANAEPFEFMGLKLWQLLIAVISGIVIIYLIVRFIVYALATLEIKRKSITDSEQHYFKLLQEAAMKEDPAVFMRQLMLWYDRFRKGKFMPTFNDFIKHVEEQELENQYEKLEQIIFSSNLKGKWSGKAMYESVRRVRKRSISALKKKMTIQVNDLNP